MKSVRDALEAVFEAFERLDGERVGLLDSAGRVTAKDIPARGDSPPFDNSAMDGYALIAGDLQGASEGSPVHLPVEGESRAGGPPPSILQAGRCMRIYTGATMPPGADCVVIQENVEREGDVATFRARPKQAQNIRAQGSDLAAGATAVPAGTPIAAGEIALLASQDYASVEVIRRPRVAILSSGDELRDIGEPARPGSIVNSNLYALAAQVREAGGEPILLPPTPDELGEAQERVERALASADVLVCSGGVSVGDYDVMREAFSRAGVELDFWKIAMKPGKPLSFGTYKGHPVIGLPGNPVGAYVTFELFVRPGLRKMLGDARPFRMRTRARLASDARHNPGRLEFARATLRSVDGVLTADLKGRQGSGALPALVGVDALVLLPRGTETFPAGTEMALLPLGGPTDAKIPFDALD